MKRNAARRIQAFVLCALMALLCCACAKSPALEPSDASTILSRLRSAYRGASLVATVRCVGTLNGPDGTACMGLRVAETLAGEAGQDELLLCEGEGFQSGGNYLVYLLEDAQRGLFTSLQHGLWNVAGDSAAFGEETLALSLLRADIAELQKVISAPAETLYYAKLASLVEASDAVCIGHVKAAPALADTAFRESSGEGTVEHSRAAAVVPVEVLGSVKGELAYGETISFVYAPAYAADLVDASTLSPLPALESEVPALYEGYFLFFLQKGPDAKQSYYFGVNPLQAYVGLQEDTLLPAAANGALLPYPTLPAMLEALY